MRAYMPGCHEGSRTVPKGSENDNVIQLDGHPRAVRGRYAVIAANIAYAKNEASRKKTLWQHFEEFFGALFR